MNPHFLKSCFNCNLSSYRRYVFDLFYGLMYSINVKTTEPFFELLELKVSASNLIFFKSGIENRKICEIIYKISVDGCLVN